LSVFAWVVAFAWQIVAHAGPADPTPLPEATAQPTWLFRVYDETVTSVVRIECGDAIGTGFFFHSPRHVATAFHVLESGRDVLVVFVDGSSTWADVVAWDPAQDVAILELGARTGRPLLPASPPSVGDSVAAIGVPMDSIVRQAHASALPIFTLTQGTVSAVTDAAVQTDAAINPGNSGGPLLDRSGRVLGVVSRKVNDAEGLAFAVPTERLLSLARRIGTQGAFWGSVSGDFELGYSFSEHELDGLLIGLRIVLFDRFGLGVRGAWMDDERMLSDDWFTETRSRSLLEAMVFYRLSFYSPPLLALHLPIGVGVAVSWDDLERTALSAELADSGCNLAVEACDFRTSGTRVRLHDNRVRPMVAAELELPPLLLSSAFYFDGVKATGGRFGVSLVF
jgi:hypothetical protein